MANENYHQNRRDFMNVPKPIECDNCKKTNDLIKILNGWECVYCGHTHYGDSKETFQVSLPKSTSVVVVIKDDAIKTIVKKLPKTIEKIEKYYPIYRRKSSVKLRKRKVTCSNCGKIFMQTKIGRAHV